MTTLSEIKSRCVEKRNCWIWQGDIERGSPRMLDANGQASVPVRVEVLRLVGHEAREGYRVVCVCGTRGCVNPEHLLAVRMSVPSWQ